MVSSSRRPLPSFLLLFELVSSAISELLADFSGTILSFPMFLLRSQSFPQRMSKIKKSRSKSVYRIDYRIHIKRFEVKSFGETLLLTFVSASFSRCAPSSENGLPPTCNTLGCHTFICFDLSNSGYSELIETSRPDYRDQPGRRNMLQATG